MSSHSGTAIDDERLLNALIQRGVICPGLTTQEQETALQIYLQRKTNNKKKPQVSNKHQLNEMVDSEPQPCISPTTQP
ncbi:hypothetical protein L4D05_07875 [Vibrio nomapromontoriensis]